jgi:hypothetical protein
VDSTIVEVHGRAKQGAAFGYTKVRGYHPQLATCAQTGQVVMSRLGGVRCTDSAPPPSPPRASISGRHDVREVGTFAGHHRGPPLATSGDFHMATDRRKPSTST